MRAGPLRHSITIQQASDAQDAMGSVTRTWSTFKAVRAEIQPIRGSESIAASQVVADATHLVRIRYLAGVVPAMRVLYGARVLEITSVADIYTRHAMMELICKEIVA